MSWLELLKTLEAPAIEATKPTKPAIAVIDPGYVGFVASLVGVDEKLKLKDDAQLTELQAVAMHVCDIKGDNDAQREQMRIEMAEYPPNKRLELIDYFRTNYPDISDYEQGQP